MTRLKFRQLVCSGHNAVGDGSPHPRMQGLKILRLKVAHLISSSIPLSGAMHESVVLGVEWNITVFLSFLFHAGVLYICSFVEGLEVCVFKEGPFFLVALIIWVR